MRYEEPFLDIPPPPNPRVWERPITYRVAYPIDQGVPAESILLVAFTRRAAREMVGRLATLVGFRIDGAEAGRARVAEVLS